MKDKLSVILTTESLIIEPRSSNENHKSFELQEQLFKNKGSDNFTKENYLNLYDKGVELWNNSVRAIQNRMDNSTQYLSKTFVFRSKKAKNKYRLTCLEINNGKFKEASINNRSKTFTSGLLINEYVKYVKKTWPTTSPCEKNAIIAAGEGALLLADGIDNAATILYKKLPDFGKLFFDIIVGPIMLKNDTSGLSLNDFIESLSALSSTVNGSKNFKLNANRLFAFEKMPAGFHHFYIINNCLFVEKPHNFYNSDEDSCWFIFSDDNLSTEYRSYFEDYKKYFTEDVTDKLSNNVEPLISTYSRHDYNELFVKNGAQFVDTLKKIIENKKN